MKRIPRKIKKIVKKSAEYGKTDFYNISNCHNWPNWGIIFLIPANRKSKRIGRYVIKFGRNVRKAYDNGLFDF